MGKMAQIHEEAKEELCALVNQGVQDVIHAVDQTAKITFPALCLIVPELVENQVFLRFKFHFPFLVEIWTFILIPLFDISWINGILKTRQA